MSWADFKIAEKLGLVVRKETVDKIQTTSSANLTAAGWYRVGVINGLASVQKCEVKILRAYWTKPSEIHTLSYEYGENSFCQIATKGSKSNTQMFTKARVTKDADNSYFEVYYAYSEENRCSFTVIDGGYNNPWKAITPTLTSETVDGVTVATIYDIPANASPVTNLDLVQFDGTEQLSTSILDKALTLDDGIHNYVLMNYTASDLPHDYYKYGMATIFKRNKSSIVVVLWGSDESTSNERRRIAVNSYSNQTWSGWEQAAFKSDLSKYLPLTGGTISTNSFTPLQINRTDQSAEQVALSFSLVGAVLAIIGAKKDGELYIYNASTNVKGKLLHTGISAPVVVSTTAPTDTTAVWIVPS